MNNSIGFIALDAMFQEIHKMNTEVGWWDHNPPLLEKLQLAITEISEGTEGFRKNIMDTKLPHRLMEEVEIADFFIRMCDFTGALGIFDEMPQEMFEQFISVFDDRVDAAFNATIGFQDHPAVMHYKLGERVYLFTLYWDEMIKNPLATKESDGSIDGKSITLLLDVFAYAMAVSEIRGFDLFTAIKEKREFNAVRPDHKKENREAPGGKSI